MSAGRVAALTLGLALTAPLAQASDPSPAARPDTSAWKCEQCPFQNGYRAEVQGGVLYADGANAPYGRYTGINHSGAYAEAGASGMWRDASGNYARYRLDDLGLPSRSAQIDGGHEGLYDLHLSYDGQPTYLYDTTVTPFRGSGPGQLSLPPNWVYAGSTSGMSALGQSLAGADLEYQRRTVALLGRLLLGTDWTMYARLSHQEKEGTGLTSGAFLTDATQLPEPIDYITNEVEAGFNWSGRWASAHLAYTGSWFQDNTGALTWQNPYLPVTAGATLGRMALPPDNQSQSGSLSGEVQLPIPVPTTLTYSASVGRLTQDAALLPLSTLPGQAGIPPPGALDGNVHLSHYALALASRPLGQLYVRGSATYDGRDDHTPVLVLPYVITDALVGGIFQTPRYGEDRTRLEGSVDDHLLGWLKAGIGGKIDDIHFAPGQVIQQLRDRRVWGYLTLTPLSGFTLEAKGGSAQRDASSVYDVSALPATENPLLLAYDYAPRDEDFYALTGTWTISQSLSWSLQGSWSDDAYRRTELGLKESRDRRIATTLGWTPLEKVSLYADASFQRLSALQDGMLFVPGAPLWAVRDSQYFWTAGAGGRWTISARWSLTFDYLHATTRGEDTTYLSTAAAPFPNTRSQLDSVSLDSTYQWNSALKVRVRYGYGRFDSNDWALDGVGIDTIPNLLTLGEQPYRYSVNTVALTVIYRFGTQPPSASPR